MDCFRLRAEALRRTPTLRSLRSKRRRVVASLLAMTVGLHSDSIFIQGVGRISRRRNPPRRVRAAHYAALMRPTIPFQTATGSLSRGGFSPGACVVGPSLLGGGRRECRALAAPVAPVRKKCTGR